MGKRKRVIEETEEEEAGEAAPDPSTSQEVVFREPVLKRIKREASSRLVNAEHGNDEGGINGLASYHQSSSSSTSSAIRLNGSMQREDERGEDTTLWLVRKPIKMPLEDLHKLHFSRKSKYAVQRLQSSESSSSNNTKRQLECRLKKLEQPMIRVSGDRRKQIDEKRILKPEEPISGMVWINELPEMKVLGSGEGNEDEVLDETPIAIASIRRKPELDERMLGERLKAFGVKPNRAEEEEVMEEDEPQTKAKRRHKHKK